MTRDEFVKTVKGKLSEYTENEINKSMEFYLEGIADRIEDGMSEEEAIEALGDIDSIVHDIQMEMSVSTLAKSRIKTSRDKAGSKALWITLVILGSPLWLSLGIAFASILFSAFLVIWSVLISIYAAELSFAVCGVWGMIAGPVHMATVSFGGGIMVMGAATLCIGLAILIFRPSLKLVKLANKATVWVLRCLKKMIVGKDEDRNE